MYSLLYPVFANFLMAASLVEWLKSAVINLGSFLFMLGVLVFVHEFGHYAVAKLFGVRVEVFSLGFGKRLWGFRRGDTDYRVSLLPLGGYVKMTGENPMEEHTGDPGDFTSHPRWQRFLIAIAGPAMNIALAIVMLTGLFMHHHGYEAYLKAPVDVIGVTPGSPAERAGLQRGDRIVKIQDIQNPTWDEFRKTEFIPESLAITIQRGAQTLKITAVPEAKGPSHMGDLGLQHPVVVGTIEPGRPALLAGMKEGDVLVSADQSQVKEFPDLFNAVQLSKGREIHLAVLRDGKEMNFPVTPKLDPDGKYRIGLSDSKSEKLAFGAALAMATRECKENSALIFKLVGKLIQAKAPIEQLSGPVGIMQESGRAAKTSFLALLFVMAMISLNLAIVNLLPIPILDGGLMLMLLIESTIRRDIKIEVKERVYQVAFVFLLLFFVVVTYFDIAKSFHG